MDAFWAGKLGQIVIGAIGGGVGALLFSFGAKILKVSDSTNKKITLSGTIICAIVAVKLLGAISQPDIATQAVERLDATITQVMTEAKPVDGQSAA